jgi:hypothetical protein
MFISLASPVLHPKHYVGMLSFDDTKSSRNALSESDDVPVASEYEIEAEAVPVSAMIKSVFPKILQQTNQSDLIDDVEDTINTGLNSDKPRLDNIIRMLSTMENSLRIAKSHDTT